MKKVLIVFGSKSDENVFNEIISGLKEENVPYEARVCSAHRTPEELDELLKNDYSVIIAGAGLAAHLPGVCASKSIKPIIGVPVNSNYEGMDSLLSIVQMPPGIPVLGVGVDKGRVAATMAAQMQKEYKRAHLFFEDKTKAVEKAVEVFKEFKVAYEENPDFEANSLNIKFVSLADEAEKGDDLIIYVPVAGKNEDKALSALNLLHNSTHGLWVGLNRGENAALGAVEIMANYDSGLREKLIAYRKKHAAKVIADDKEVKKR